MTIVPLPGNQFSVPAEQSVRGDDGGDFLKRLTAKDLAFDGKASSLVIVEENTFFAQLLLEDLVLRDEIFDDALLFLIDPASQGEQKQMPRV